MNRLGWIFVGVFIFVTVAPSVAQEEPFKLLATNRTGTMEEELNEAGAAGYRVVGMQGGETGFGGNQVVVIMALDPEGRRFRYVLLATSRTGTLESELNELPPGFSFVGMTRPSLSSARAARSISPSSSTCSRGLWSAGP